MPLPAPWEPLPDGSPVVEALVQVGLEEIPYRRAGKGRPVLLLVPPDRKLPAGWLTARVGWSVVIQPLTDPRCGGGAAWVACLVDGLGLDSVELVVAGADAARYREVAALDPWRVRLVTGIAVDDEDH